ncbi:sensor histidine kinase [Roseivirga sp.]|uniref:sensor histidine kinase n=1 Tax=Roseivirga sp. TaxID=1964215 RepID=UPI003B8CB74D
MIKKQSVTIPLTIFSLMCMLAIQAYFLRADFFNNKTGFANDVNASLELIIGDVQEDREERKHQLHKIDLLDTNYFKIEYVFNNGVNPTVSLIEAATNNRLMKYNFITTYDPDTLTKEFLFNKAFGNNGRLKNSQRVYMSITEAVDNRFNLYEDTLSVNKKMLDSLLVKNFKTYQIQANHELVFIPKEGSYTLEDSQAFISDFFIINDKGAEKQVGVLIPEPFWNIVQRSTAVIIASVFAVVLVVFSFWFLTNVIKKQRLLAQTKDDFIDNVTHELLTPISTLHVSLESLDRYHVLDNKEKARDYLKISKMELNRISGLLQNVLQVSLHSPGLISLSMTEVSLKEIVHDTIDYYKVKSKEDIDFKIVPFKDVKVKADLYRLNNVFYNLVDNALKYCRRSPKEIQFSVEIGDKVVVNIQDNGIGIQQEDRKKIFDKFHRVSQNGVHNVKGMGIGLYQSKTIMNKMGGDLRLKSSSESGSIFSIHLKPC